MINEPANELPAADRQSAPELFDQPLAAPREQQIEALTAELDGLLGQPESASQRLAMAHINLRIAGLQLDLDQRQSAATRARDSVDALIEGGDFEAAATACQYVYLACLHEPENALKSIAAIGQAAWLAVTYPVDPQLTATILDHIVDETPDNADGAAVAAATAHYVADLRSPDNHDGSLQMFTGNMLARVARRHSDVRQQSDFERWVRQLELDDPACFLPRLRNVIDVMVQDEWWFDRQALTRAIDREAANNDAVDSEGGQQ